MSEALERVIAEQQAEVDRLRADAERNVIVLAHQNERIDRLAKVAFALPRCPENREHHHVLWDALAEMGFCTRCECRPCECGDD